MLYVSTELSKFDDFFNLFKEKFKDVECIDLSKIALSNLADESDSVVAHHKDCIVFLGYIEPGWMLDYASQTRIRKLFRKFPVGLILNFSESLPFSWKNEIDTIYTFKSLNNHGSTNTFNNDCSLQHELKI